MIATIKRKNQSSKTSLIIWAINDIDCLQICLHNYCFWFCLLSILFQLLVSTLLIATCTTSICITFTIATMSTITTVVAASLSPLAMPLCQCNACHLPFQLIHKNKFIQTSWLFIFGWLCKRHILSKF